MNYTFYVLETIFKVIVTSIVAILIVMAFIRIYQYDKREWEIKNSRVKRVDTKARLKKMNRVRK